MPIARFKLPDGRVARFEVPEGTTPEQAQAMIAEQFTPSERVDLNKDNSFLQNLGAGIGKGMTSVARALGASPEWLRSQGLPGSKDEAEAQDTTLSASAGGKIGNVVGQAALAAPAAFVPGANTYAGATLLGGLTGGAFTEGDFSERARGAAFGAAGGAAGKGLGDALGKYVPLAVQKLKSDRLGAQAANAQRDAAAQAAQQAGYVIPPADIRQSALNEALGGFSGKLKTAQEASARNQSVTNDLARQALGIQPGATLDRAALKTVRDNAGQAYDAMRNLGTIQADKQFINALGSLKSTYAGASKSFPGLAKNEVEPLIDSLRVADFDSGSAIDAIKVLRETADKAFRTGDSGLGKAAKGAAGELEGMIERHLQQSGAPDLLKVFQEARKAIAKSYTVEKALNPATGDVAAPVLARELMKGKPLSGELRKVAEVASAFPKATQALKEAPKAVSPLDFMAGLITAGSTGPLGAAAIGARPMVRSALLSKAGQGLLARPSTYQAGLLEQSLPYLENEALRRALPLTGGLLGLNLAE